MRNASLFTLAMMVLLLGAAPLNAQCQMQYNISVYTDGSVSDDLSTVYGSSNFIDNSTLCGATHSNYQSITTIYPPSGPSVQQQEFGFESNAQIATYGVLGTYQVEGGDEFYCSVAQENIQNDSGGAGDPVPVQALVSLTVTVVYCTLHLQDTTCGFIVTASAGGGFQGTVSGTITVSGSPVNPNNVNLSMGTASEPFNFTLAAGQSTPGSCSGVAPQFCYQVTTAHVNENKGTLTWTVTLDNDTHNPPLYTVPSGQQVAHPQMTVVQ